jgi:hypothetical protein
VKFTRRKDETVSETRVPKIHEGKGQSTAVFTSDIGRALCALPVFKFSENQPKLLLLWWPQQLKPQEHS